MSLKRSERIKNELEEIRKNPPEQWKVTSVK
jgi:hypothetical protein